MAAPTNTVTRYDVYRSVREDLADTIYRISPEDTPFMSNVGRGKADNTYFEWQTDALAAADADNKHIEGDDAVNDARAPTKRLGNYTQIARKVVGVSGTSEAVDKAGIRGMLAYEMAKASAELKRDMEKRLVSDKAAAGGNNSTARETAGFGAFLITNVDKASDGVDQTFSVNATKEGYPNAAYTPGTARAYTEAQLKDTMQKVWAEGGSLDICMMGPRIKMVASGFKGIAEFRKNLPGESQATIIGAADVYVGDFGSVTFVPNRFMDNDKAYLIDPEYASVVYLRDFRTENLAKTGDSTRKMLLVEFGLKVHTELAHGVIRDLDPDLSASGGGGGTP